MDINQVSWAELGIFWTSVTLAIITVSATVINYLFFRSQVDPHVIVYATPDEERSTIIILIIENIGRGVAKDVVFTLSEPIPMKAFGFDNAPIPENMRYGPLIDGIPCFGPGAKRILTWGQYGGLKKGMDDRIVNITAVYKTDRLFSPWKRTHKTVSVLDIKSFEGTDSSEKNWGKRIVDQLEKISRILSQSASGFKTLKIELVDKKNNDGKET